MANKYLEKVAEHLKLAFDTDYENGDEYGIAANRSISNPDVIGMLRKATKDPKVHVTVDEFSHIKHPKEFHKRLNEIEGKVKEYNKANPNPGHNTMNWHRDHAWSIGMKKSDPFVKSRIGKESKDGDPIENETDSIFYYLHEHHF